MITGILIKLISHSRFHGIGCALLLPICALAVQPNVEIGISDDWSYVKTAQVLAAAGHFVYNGWATAMLGWQVVLAALFIRLFGFSFFIVRLTTLILAMICALLSQRIMVRCGIQSWTAVIGTLTFMLSPILLPLAFTFMTDIPGLFCILLCIYTCIRALQAASQRATIQWIVFAALSNAIGGTVRQIAWLGVLVILPMVIWLLRRHRRVVVVGSLMYLIAVSLIVASMHWFASQPYSVPEPLVRGDLVSYRSLHIMAHVVAQSLLVISFYALPALVLFLPAVRLNRRSLAMIASANLACLGAGVILKHFGRMDLWLFPYFYHIDGTLHGINPVKMSRSVRMLLTLINLEVVCCILPIMFDDQRVVRAGCHLRDLQPEDDMSWRKLWIVIGPFAAFYSVLVISRSPFQLMFDRYLYPLLFFALLVLLRLCEQLTPMRFTFKSLIPLLLFVAGSIAGAHDTFAEHRAQLQAIGELRSSGIPATSIDGGFEYNGWTQIEAGGHVNDPRIRVPDNVYVQTRHVNEACKPFFDWLFPAVTVRYALSYDAAACGGRTDFPPVSYSAWSGLRRVSVYVVNTGQPLAISGSVGMGRELCDLQMAATETMK